MESVASEISKRIGYMVHYKDNIKNLKARVVELKAMEVQVQCRVEEGERYVYWSDYRMKSWLSVVVDMLEQVRPFLQDDEVQTLNTINLKSRYELGKRATKMEAHVLALLREAASFPSSSSQSHPLIYGYFGDYFGFESESRQSIISKLLDALMDDKVSMVSICGMMGVGKTTLARQLVKVIKERHLMDVVCMLVVSHIPDLGRIQSDLIAQLGWRVDVSSLDGRAAKVHTAFMQQNRRTLLILDDVWERVDLKTIGIPLPGDAKGVKILLTSQNVDVCNMNGSQRNFSLNPLTNEEAWILFKEESYLAERPEMHELAMKIVHHCGGLPVAVVRLANSLRKGDIYEWNDALEMLRPSSLQDYGFDDVYSAIKRSYDRLPTEEHKSCFLLCGLFLKGSSILIEDVVRYVTRLGLSGNTGNIFQARESVHTLIREVKRASLLLEGDTGDSVRMHDLFHDFAVSITTTGKSYVSLDHEKLDLLDKAMLKSCKTMSLVWEVTEQFPVLSQCPNLESLLFVSRRSSESIDFFFQGIKTGELGNLVALVIRTHSSTMLPENIRLLTNLRLLDLHGMSGLKYIPPGVLSKLSELKELYITPEFRRWGSRVEGEDGERTNASLEDLQNLPIIALQISTPKASILPRLPFFGNLVQCEIRVGDTLLSIGEKSNNELVLEGDASDVKGSGICALLEKTEDLRLVRVEDFKSIIDNLIHDTRQIPSSPDTQLQYFHNLRSLAIEFCDDLKHVFPASVARTLAQLKEIRINDCSKMEGFLYGEREIEVVEFPCLTNLELIGVPNLKCFWVDIDIDNAGAGILPNQSSDDDTAMKTSTSYWKGTSSSMEQLSTSEIKTKSSLGYVELHFVVFPSWIRLPNLEEFRLHGCRLLRVAFPSTIASQLVKLRILEIKWCFKMEYIVGGPEEKDRRSSIPVFPELTSFIVDDLPELMAFSSESHMYLERISLDELKVTKCPKIKTLFETLPPDYETSQNKLLVSTNEVLFKIPPQVQRSINVKFLEVGVCDNLSNVFSTHAANLLMGLERMEIRYCEKMREIVGKEEEEEEEEEQEVFHACDLLSLEFVTFDGCFQLKTFSYKNHFNTPNLKQININGSKYEIIEDLNTTIEKVMSTKSLIFDMKELERIEPVLIPDKDAIRDLEIEGCDKLMNAIPCNLIARLRKLEKLAVRWCDSLEEIFEYEDTINFEEESNVTFSCLEEITMFDLENLKHVFTRIPKTIIGFQKLRKLCVHGCRSLRNIFSVSSVRGLLQLQELKISSCNGLQEIVAKENKEEQASRDRIAFPQLRRIEISDTCTLESFYSGVYDLVMPLLESLHLNKCPCIKKFSNGSLTAPKLHKVQGDCMGTSLIRTSPVVDLDEIITKKKKRTQLRIYNREKLQNIGHDQLPYGDLSQIHELEIQACDELLCAIPSNLKPTDLQKLEKLVVRRCRLLEEIFDQQGASFGSGSITTFSNLEEITLLHLEKLQHVFCEIPKETVCFQKLRKLHIHDCYSLLNIFTVSTAKGLQELKELKLSSCDALEEIVAEGEKEEQAIKDEIVFPQLRSIDISYSPKLVFFYSGIYALKLPSLKSVFLYNCPCMLTFSKGLLITPSEVKVQIDNGNYKLLEDGLNDTMKYKDLLLQQDKNSQGSEEHQQDSEFPSGSKAQMYNNTDGSRLSAEYIAALEHENQMMKRQLTFMEHRIANLEH